MRRSWFGWIGLWIVVTGCGTEMGDEVRMAYGELPDVIDYNIDVKPILSDRCYHCHGPDEGTRGADMRLDTREGLFAKNEFGNRPFVAGNLSKSTAIERILSDDPETMMPPPSSNRSLSSEEKARLIKWVEQGAEWKEHWSFIVPKRPKIPVVSQETTNPIDNFVLARLEQNGLKSSKTADPETLLRRVTMDLTGLPPTIGEIDAFLSDDSENAFEKVVDRLLKTTAHAERMTLEWLDVARYADSHGFHADGIRTSWPWRDWVIEAFGQNMPYDQFVTEQLAGDLLPNPTRDQIIATAFNRNHPMTAEGGVVDEEFRVEYVANRTNTFGTAFLGLTVECARCHDHKFDPISQKEYYEISAFFNNIKELGMTGDDGDYGPMVQLTDEKTEKLIAYLEGEIAEAESKLPLIPESKEMIVAPVLKHSFERITKTDSSRFLDGIAPTEVFGEIDFEKGISGQAPVFDHQDDRIYANEHGLFDAYDPFSVSIWIHPTKDNGLTKVILGNAGEKNSMWRGWDLYLDSANHLAFRLISSLPHNYIHVRSDQAIPLDTWTHVMATYDGSSKAGSVRLSINGKKAPSTIVFDQLYKTIYPTNTRRTREDRAMMIGKSYRAFTGDNGLFMGQVDELLLYDIEVPEDQFVSVMEAGKTGDAYGVRLDLNRQRAVRDLKAIRKKRLETYDSIPELMVMEEMSTPRPTFVLNRGEYNKPTDEVKPGVIEKVKPFEGDANRLGLSKWLFDSSNPLTARVAVNRYWQMVFGQGIVTTVNDFGSQGALPSHPELLDWLAVEFLESNWDVRHLIRLMVTSNTYRQSSRIQGESAQLDPMNTWLARGPSYRMPAEMIRDNALASSGLMNTKVGGESAKPYQPDGLWIELGNFSHFLLNYSQDHDDRQYRRSMYTFIRRTSPPPFLTLFDGPNREVCTVTRERTNTPLQALVLLNDPQFVEASRALAVRLKHEGDTKIEDQIRYGFRLVLSREPSRQEVEVMKKLYLTEFDRFSKRPEAVKEYLSVGDYQIPGELNKTEIAALAVVGNTLYNMDEAYTKR